jgi:hypothetical protein
MFFAAWLLLDVKKSRLTYCDIFEDGPVTPLTRPAFAGR